MVFHKLYQEIVLIVSVSESYNKIIGKNLLLFHIRGNLYIIFSKLEKFIAEIALLKVSKKKKLIFSQNSSEKKKETES